MEFMVYLQNCLDACNSTGCLSRKPDGDGDERGVGYLTNNVGGEGGGRIEAGSTQEFAYEQECYDKDGGQSCADE